ncbi:MAG: leucyl/phenylalanyl-tRNA--protein transferase [Bacteroidota bacterium]
MGSPSEEIWFPPVTSASQEGLLALGGDLSLERLLLAYRSGIFPWYSEGDPILWWSPDPRMVLYPDQLKISKSMRKVLRTGNFECTRDKAFAQVARHCAAVKRTAQAGTWITDEMLVAYEELHKAGHAHSIEVWEHGVLVGGLYGVDLPKQKIFCGESMFSLVSNASKVALHFLTQQLAEQDYALIDCQVYNQHLESIGAIEIPRAQFLRYLE